MSYTSSEETKLETIRYSINHQEDIQTDIFDFLGGALADIPEGLMEVLGTPRLG